MPQTCVISGATSGIGRAVALDLAGKGWHLVLLGRDRARGERVVREATSQSTCPGAVFHRLDFGSAQATREIAASIAARYPTIDLLINNAGARYDSYAVTVEGIERTFVVNHLAHVILTFTWLPNLAASPAGRVVAVTSSAAAQARPDIPWLLDSATFDRRQAYAQAKLATRVFALELDRRLEGTSVRSLAWEPGIVFTRFARNNGLVSWLRHVAYHALRRELHRPTTVARALVGLMEGPLPAARGGLHFRIDRPVSSAAPAPAVERVRELWALSLDRAGIDPAFGSTWSWPRAQTTPGGTLP